MDLSIFGSLAEAHHNTTSGDKFTVNDPIHSIVKCNKSNTIEFQRIKTHLERKRALNQDRVEVLRCKIRRYLKSGVPGRMAPTNIEVEEYLDWILHQHDYDLEDAIATYRNILPAPVLVCKCGLRPPFCSCGGIPVPGMVSCDQCEFFTPDKIGSGAGIGACGRGVDSTREIKGRTPLYRYAARHCTEFSQC